MKKVIIKTLIVAIVFMGAISVASSARADWGFSVGISTGGFGGYASYGNQPYYGGNYYQPYNSYGSYGAYNGYGYNTSSVSSYSCCNQPYYQNYQPYYMPAYLPSINSYNPQCGYYYGC